MDNPFSYPSLAFGAEAMQLGDSLKRYQSFRNETDPLETEQDRDNTPPPGDIPDDTPPAGGLGTSKEISLTEKLLFGSIFFVGVYLAANYSEGQFDISLPTF